MSAALALTPPINPRTIAPEDWQYLGDLIDTPTLPLPTPAVIALVLKFRRAPPTLYDWAAKELRRVTREQHHREKHRRAAELKKQHGERESPPTVHVYRTDAPRIPPTKVRELTPAHLDAIKHAARVAGARFRLKPEDRWDLRQELAIKLIERHDEISNVEAWLCRAALNYASNSVRDETRRRELREEERQGAAVYPRGVRTLDCEQWGILGDPEDALLECIDERAANGEGPARTPTCAQDRIAEQAIREKRESTLDTKKVTVRIRAGVSSL